MSETRFFVQAMHTPSNGFDSQRTVEYWRVTDRESGMRADGTAKYDKPEDAQRWCDGLNQTGPETAGVKRLSAPSGNRDSDRFQAVCGCGWSSLATHSNRTVEGRRLAQRDADDHNKARHPQAA